MNTFGELIERETQCDLMIKDYFNKKNMQAIVTVLTEEDVTMVKELLPPNYNKNKNNDNDDNDDDDDTKEHIKEVFEMLNDNLNEKYQEWECEKKECESKDGEFTKPKPLKELKFMHKNELKCAIGNPQSWQEIERRQIFSTKESLNDVSPKLSLFFEKMNEAMKQVDLLLNYDRQLNDDQKEAIKQIKNKGNNSNNDVGSEYDHDNDEKKEICLDVPVETERNSNDLDFDTENDMDFIMNDDNLEIENPNVLLIANLNNSAQLVSKECDGLNKASINKLNIICTMRNSFLQSLDGTRALGFAQSIENTCIKIVQCKGYIRQSIMLCFAILELKPPNITMDNDNNNNKINPLWKSIDKGIVQIFNSAMQVKQATEKYLQFFTFFQNSFEYYNSKKNESLELSTKYLKRDIKKFHQFSIEFEKQVENLGEKAMECISKCVENTVGFTTFENARQQRSELLKNYLDRKKRYDEKCASLDIEFDNKLKERAELNAAFKTKELIIDALQQQINFERNLMKTTQDTMNTLRQGLPINQ